MRKSTALQWWSWMARTDWNRPALVPLDPSMKRIKMTVAYDGSAYNGWQCQSNGTGVQDVLNERLSGLYGCEVSVQGSGRTDSGVHALGQVCHYDVPADASSLPDDRVWLALNAVLPYTIRVLSSERTDGNFHARFTTMAREYKYFAAGRNESLPFDWKYTGLYSRLPDLGLLNSYAAALCGTHDFTTFASAKDRSQSHFRDIYESYWTDSRDRFSRPVYCYTVTGNAFMYHQVRSMVGTMMMMAINERPAQDFVSLLEARDRSLALTSAPAGGLYLSRISYDSNEYLWFEKEGS